MLSEFSRLISKFPDRSTLSEVLVEFHQQFLFILDFKLLVIALIIEDKISGFIGEFSIKIIVFRYFADCLHIPFDNFLLFPHF